MYVGFYCSEKELQWGKKHAQEIPMSYCELSSKGTEGSSNQGK